MSYEEKIEVFQNDYGYDINMQATDKDGTVINLTNCTIKWRVWEQKQSQETTPTCKFIGTCSIVDAATGKCKYTVQSGNFDLANVTYSSQLVLTKTPTTPVYELKCSGLTVHVIEEAPSV